MYYLNLLKEVDGILQYAVHKDFEACKTVEDLQPVMDYINDAVEGNCEGLMVKLLHDDASYKLDKRAYTWLKVNLSIKLTKS